MAISDDVFQTITKALIDRYGKDAVEINTREQKIWVDDEDSSNGCEIEVNLMN